MRSAAADAAALAGDHADALHWLDVVEAVGSELSAEYTTNAWHGGASCAEPARQSSRRRERDEPRSFPHPRRHHDLPALSALPPGGRQKAAWMGMVRCPRCLARGGVAVELFSSPLPPDSLYAETQPTEGLPA